MQLLINELAGAITQLLILALLPFLWWLVTARRKESVLSWLGLKKIDHTGRLQHTILITAAASLAYAVLTGLCVGASTSAFFSFSLTSACVFPSTFLKTCLPVIGSCPAVYRPSQRPSLRFRMLPSPFARFFAIAHTSFAAHNITTEGGK